MPYKKDSNRCEVLLYNNVDTDLQDMLRPLNFIQTIYLSPKYTIKDGYITPNSLFCNILSAAGAIVFFSICVYRILTASKIGTFEGFSTTLLITKYFDAILFSLGFVANAYVSIRLSHLNVLLYLKLQAIKTFVPCKKIMQKVKYYNDQKLFLKTVQRLNKANISKLDVYGLFIVDATLPLRLIQVIATYTIVLLQFAFQ
uniref:Uncharacterized protein n=1 Tax=Bombyx mori TaxID=7091 RepID=A0A8R2LTY4_BOMMO|nr:uncharacterized protein LOC119628533 [Bombyx mori]